MFSRAARQLVQLASMKPASRLAARASAELEHFLLRFLTGGGLATLERVVAAARLRGLHLQPSAAHRGYRAWEQEVPARNGVLEVRGFSSRAMRYVRVSWLARRAPLTPAQQRLHQTQEAFYARYMAAGRRAYASPPKRIGADDRCILLIGEFEADVNNGGFDQYLNNKGRRRASEAVRALRRVGASAAADLLETALKPALSEAARSRLDGRFYKLRENLALLGARAFGLSADQRTGRPS